MKSKTSFISKGVLLNDFKRFSWIAIAYFLGLLLTIPLKITMLYSQETEEHLHSYWMYSQVFNLEYSPLLAMLILIVPIITGMLLFRYIQAGKAADMEHSLPIKRTTLFNTHVLTGILVLLIPLILTTIVSWLLITSLGIEQNNIGVVMSWLTTSIIINMLIFITSAAICMVTGMSILQGILTYIVLFLPTGLSLLTIYNLNLYIYGFASDYYAEQVARLSPLVRLVESRFPLTITEIITYTLLIIALYLIGKYLYKYRQLERAGNAITFDILRPIFKYGVTFSFMLLGGLYFHSTQNTLAWTYFGYFLGSILSYFLVEILLTKSLHVFNWKNIKGYSIYSIIIIIAISLMQFTTAYETRQPNLDQVESIYFSGGFYLLNQHNMMSTVATPIGNVYRQSESTYEWSTRVAPIFKEPENIAKIFALHQAIINNIDEEKSLYLTDRLPHPRESIALVYELKNGKRFVRHYNISTVKYTQELKPIYESAEFKYLTNETLRIKPEGISLIEISVYDINKNVRLADPEVIEKALAALRQDIYEKTYDDMTLLRGKQRKTPFAIIKLYSTNNEQLHESFEKNYVNFEEFLKEIGEYENARLLPGSDISKVLIEKNTSTKEEDRWTRSSVTNQYLQELEAKEDTIVVTDLEKIEQCIHHYYEYVDEPIYNVYLKLNNGIIQSGYFTETDLPEFLNQ